MGDMTRDEMVTEICDIVGKSVSAAAVSSTVLQTRVRTYLNFAQRRIARFYSFPELDTTLENVPTVIGQKTYTYAALGLTNAKDIHSVKVVDGANSRRLKRWRYKELDKRIPDPTNYATGRPSIYMCYGKQMELFRLPDAVYQLTIRFPKWPTVFTTAMQTSDYEDKDELLITCGVMETYLALEEYTDAAVWYQRTMGMLRDMEMDDEDVDWEPEGMPFDSKAGLDNLSGEPWLDPTGTPEDPLYGYSAG